MDPVLLYYVTDRSQFPGDENGRREALIANITEAARCGVDLIQLREKDLSSRELESLAHAAVKATRQHSGKTRLLINSRTDIAIACGADGVHLRSEDVSPMDVCSAWMVTGAELPYIGVSCHTRQEVAKAISDGADFVVFAPVFEKKGAVAAGIAALRDACRENIPVIALGGVTTENAKSCIEAGAAGIAGIRLFQQNDVSEVIKKLRG